MYVDVSVQVRNSSPIVDCRLRSSHSAKEFLISLSVRNVSWATFAIMSYEYDVPIGNRNMRFGVKAHHKY